MYSTPKIIASLDTRLLLAEALGTAGSCTDPAGCG
jgi:hypothetical protein